MKDDSIPSWFHVTKAEQEKLVVLSRAAKAPVENFPVGNGNDQCHQKLCEKPQQ